MRAGQKGIERESLRVTQDNRLSQLRHPVALGAPLTHPYITTDYSEAQLEFVTPPFADMRDVLNFQHEIHAFTYSHLGDELLWSSSMPCIVRGESSVPIAQFGPSNAGQFKHVYRRGLEARYRRIMQVISGVHFNYSVPAAFWPVYQVQEQDTDLLADFISASYFGMVRNIQRFDWFITYLFGCSPALCKSFMDGLPNDFTEFDRYTFFEEYATSLRMSDIGYKNQAASLLRISHDTLDGYVQSLWRATETPYAPYADLGLLVDGVYRQLNTNILQIENEFYGSVRPKQVVQKNERPLIALAARGVGYLELRSLDVNAFHPLGVYADQLYFLEAFMLFCLLHESPPHDDVDQRTNAENQSRVAHQGRRPGLKLLRNDTTISLREWALLTLDRIALLADVLDADDPAKPYSRAVAAQRAAVEDPERTPSAQVLREMRVNQETFFEFARRQAERHQQHFVDHPTSPYRMAELNELASQSRQQQAELEARETGSFEDYLTAYYRQIPAQRDRRDRREVEKAAES
jgi:glutamate--cysteine ligase